MLTLIASAAGCSPESAEPPGREEAINQARSPIAGGYLDDEDKHAVAIVWNDGENIGICSGSLIAPNVVLTARHCVGSDSAGAGAVECNTTTFLDLYPPSMVQVTTETTMPSTPDEYLLVAEVLVPMGSDAFCGHDIALLRLEDPIPEAVVSPVVPRVDEEPFIDEMYSAIGHGARSENAQAEFTRYRRDDLFVRLLGSEPTIGTPIVDGEWLGDTGVCRGDSGGGAYDDAGRVMGIASLGDAGCGAPVYTNVFSWGEWLKANVADAVMHTDASPPPWTQGYPTDPAFSFPVGSPCESPQDCPSGLCLDGICTRPCVDEAPCPDGYACNAELQLCEEPREVVPPAAPAPVDAEVGCGCSFVGAPPRGPSWLLLLAGLTLVTAMVRGRAFRGPGVRADR